ncbi:hypothetical protein M8R20_41790 [Pseudomonas sp. R2.Fl]|nr:hypothetical protein [Pseudomonas sp. R2.Fl]
MTLPTPTWFSGVMDGKEAIETTSGYFVLWGLQRACAAPVQTLPIRSSDRHATAFSGKDVTMREAGVEVVACSPGDRAVVFMEGMFNHFFGESGRVGGVYSLPSSRTAMKEKPGSVEFERLRISASASSGLARETVNR